ncbi:MAG: polyprenyl diphosphate synthase [Planctomycetota bacterium]
MSEAHEPLHHIAFIMDGNGRWAKKRRRVRLYGHENGAESIRRISRFCRAEGVSEITFYALSTENFTKRPRHEVAYLMKLLKRFVIGEREELTGNNIRFAVIGDISVFPKGVVKEIEKTLELTAHCDGMVLRLALNYGSRQEILRAAKALAIDVANGVRSEQELETLDEVTFRSYLLDPEMSDPDLVIRTAGEYRLSNFLLWQSSYSEWWVTDRLWPDFTIDDLEAAIDAYRGRERKYGTVGSSIDDPKDVEAELGGDDASELGDASPADAEVELSDRDTQSSE